MFKFFRKKQPPQPKPEEIPAEVPAAGTPTVTETPPAAPPAPPDVPAADVWNRSAQRQAPVAPEQLPPEQPRPPVPASGADEASAAVPVAATPGVDAPPLATPAAGAGLVAPAERVAPPTAADLPPAAPSVPDAQVRADVPPTAADLPPAAPPVPDAQIRADVPAAMPAQVASGVGAAGSGTGVSDAIAARADAPAPDVVALSGSPSGTVTPTVAPTAPAAPVAPATPATPAAPPPSVTKTVPPAAPKVGGSAVERPGQAAKACSLSGSPSAPPQPAGAAAPEAGAKTSWLARLKSGLSRTGQSLTGLFVNVKVDEDLFEELETALIMADAGVEATNTLLNALRARVRKERIEDGARVKAVLRELLTEHLKPLEQSFDLQRAAPLVVMIAGVNGAGKTTSIGKLARTFQQQGSSVLLAAGDTFRAAAREQLVEWGERNNVAVIAQGDGSDPAAVAFDAVQAGRARGKGVVMIDTAGRLPTQLHLMAELKKIRRVVNKADEAAPHEVLLVVDGNTGQNALAQIKAFDDALGLTGLVVTKLDGTAKGGILAAVASGSQGVRPVPVYWIGVGEGIDDLQPFVASEFSGALLGS